MDTKRFNGMNGTIMLNTVPEGIPVGRVPGEPYGYQLRPLLVTVDIRMEREERSDTYQTTEHETVSRPLSFALTTNVWRPDGRDIVMGGATVAPLLEITDRWTNGFDPITALDLARLGERWHLNTMRAGCAHQTVVWEAEPYRRPSLELTEPCPVTGYRYGSAWLVEPLPADFLERLGAILEPTDQTRIYRNPELGR